METWKAFILLHCLVFFSSIQVNLLVLADDTIATGKSLFGKQTIISKGGYFELGFFTRVTTHKFYLGIWYKNISPKTYVWVANRDKPILDVVSELKLLDNGNLALFDYADEQPIWSTKSTSRGLNSTVAVLLDTGNLVLRDQLNPDQVIWQSFDHPTDTWLPGGRLGFNKVTGERLALNSWMTFEDPSNGTYSLILGSTAEGDQLQMWWADSISYWNSGSWNGQSFALAPELGSSNTGYFDYINNVNESYFAYSAIDGAIVSRIVLNSSGQIMLLTWIPEIDDWNLIWSRPKNRCDVYSICGAYSICDQTNPVICRCLDGFDENTEAEWAIQNRTGGCVRREALQCGNDGKEDGFLPVNVSQLPTDAHNLSVWSPQDCKLACSSRCNCTAFAYHGGCQIWYNGLLNVQQLIDNGSNNTSLNIRLAAAQLKEFKERGSKKMSLLSSKQKKKLLIIGGINGGAVSLLFCSLACYVLKRKFGRLQDSRKLDLGMKKGHKLPLFSLSSVIVATDNFSAANRLGQGGFGPVYKGRLPNGLEVAVKRLSRGSVQGLEEFKNEVTLISELQHVNLVNLVGCCIEDEEKILIYEYMENKSLDFFLFDPANQVLLNWTKRKHIIEGIAQGLLYLHKYSRLKIIHRDLKASNVLLDNEMNPKISDFGMARIYAGNESQANTNRVVGTFGYMAPEYAVEGSFSVKSDVFSFGILLLEIVTGRRATSFRQPGHYSNILEYAWELWRLGRCLETVDPSLSEHPAKVELARYIKVGLLCVQEHASDRPIIADVISMLSNENIALPEPKKPAYLARKGEIKPIPCSPNFLTISELEAR